MSLWKKATVVLVSLGMLALTMAGCSHPGATSNAVSSGGKPVIGGTIQLDFNYNIKDLDPAKAYDTASYEPVEVMYDRLVTYQGSTSAICRSGRWPYSSANARDSAVGDAMPAASWALARA